MCSLHFFFHWNLGSDAIIINTCDESEVKGDKASDDSNHNTENGESKMIDEIETKENNANDVVVVVKEENQNMVENYAENDDSNYAVVRNVIGELKGVYNEFLTQMKLVQKDLIRAAKYDELESKVWLSTKKKKKKPFENFQFEINPNSFDKPVDKHDARIAIAAEGASAT